MHVRCLNIARQLELRSHLMRSVGIADTTMTASAVGSVVRIDSFPEVSRWAHTSFDWRGLGFIRDADAEAFAGLVLQRVLGTVSPAKVATNDAAPPPRAAPVEEAEAASPLPAAGRRLRSCNCERYHPHWCAEDERRRMELPTRLWNRSDDDGATGTTTAARWPPINFVLDGDIVENRSWGERQQRRTQEFSTNMSNIWNRSKTCRGSALGRSTATMTCPLRDRGSPCGPVPISFDASHEWVIRQIDTRWPLKPQYVEFPCHEYIQFPSAALGDEERAEPLGPPRCLIFFSRRGLHPVADADNYPDVDLEECFSSGRIRPLVIGHSYQYAGLPHQSVLLPKGKRHPVGRQDVEGYVGYAYTQPHSDWMQLTFEGSSVLEYRWDPDMFPTNRRFVLQLRPFAEQFTHIVLGAQVHGPILKDFLPAEVADGPRQYVDFFATADAQESPDLIQTVLQIDIRHYARPMEGYRPDVCMEDYRIRMFREASLCGAVDALRRHHTSRQSTASGSASTTLPASIDDDGNASPLTRGEPYWNVAPSVRATIKNKAFTVQHPPRGYRVFDPWEMTSRKFSERCMQWDGTHFDDLSVPLFIFYANHAPQCREQILATTQAKVLPSPRSHPQRLRKRGRDDEAKLVDDDNDNDDAGSRCGPLNCRHPTLTVSQLPDETGAALDALMNADPRHLGLPRTKLCGCMQYKCAREEYDNLEMWMKIADQRRRRFNITKMR